MRHPPYIPPPLEHHISPIPAPTFFSIQGYYIDVYIYIRYSITFLLLLLLSRRKQQRLTRMEILIAINQPLTSFVAGYLHHYFPPPSLLPVTRLFRCVCCTHCSNLVTRTQLVLSFMDREYDRIFIEEPSFFISLSLLCPSSKEEECTIFLQIND